MSETRFVVIAVDLSRHSEETACRGFESARVRSVPAFLLNVIDDRFPYPDFYAIDHPDSDFLKENRERALPRLHDLVKRYGQGVQAEVHVAHGRPWETIVDIAAQKGAGLVVVGASGLGESRHHLGGTAEKIVRQAACSVLVVREEVPPHPAR